MTYDYFNQSLHRKIENFGRERMRRELSKIQQVFTDCKNDPNSCVFEKLDREKKISEKIDFETLTASKYLKYMDDNWGWCENPYNPYNKIRDLEYSGKFNFTCEFTDEGISKNIVQG